MSNNQDNQQQFVKFYNDLIHQYEQTIRNRTMFAVFFGAGFFTVSTVFLLYVLIGNDICTH